MLKTVGNPSTRYGDQTIINGNLVIGTAGKGIDFSSDPHADGMTSELLDDYEEGNWTPVITGSTSGGTGTYSAQSGRYTKIGNLVFVTARLSWSAHTGTGNLRMSLPFATTYIENQVLNVLADNLTFLNQLAARISNNTALVEFRGIVTDAATSVVAIDSAVSYLAVTGCYRVD